MRPLAALLASSLFVAFAATPRPSHACGGLFCSRGNPIAVEQNAERILFVKEADGRYSAYVEIAYAGDPQAFSWIVPVAETPELGVVSPSTLQVLDLMTRPSIVAPPTQCGDPLGGRRGGGCGFNADPPLAAKGAGADGAAAGVVVQELPRVGPFEPKVLSSDSPQELFDWLNDNGYLLTSEMRPFIEAYSAKKMKFLALRLAPDASVSQIQPIKMTYRTPCPFVPLSLTAVSAEPEMSVLVMFLGESRMHATNYKNLTIPAADVRMDGAGRDNYYALLSSRIDEAGGRAFVTEFAGPSKNAVKNIFLSAKDGPEAQIEAMQLLDAHPYVTRLYSRLSAWEMTLDPEFEPTPEGDVPNVFDLSSRPPVEVCGDDTRTLCGSTYCGPGASCGVDAEGREGCVCPTGEVVRPVTLPDLRRGSVPGLVCQNRSFSVLLSVPFDIPCTTLACGGGECVLTNGFPTCRCPAGQVAVVDSPGGTTSGAISRIACRAPAETFAPERLTWSESALGCTATGAVPLTLLGLATLLRRRRSRA